MSYGEHDFNPHELPRSCNHCSYFVLRDARFSQLDTGTITGTVRDSSSAVLSGAEISVRSVGTESGGRTRSNDQGIYVSPPLRPGEYTVTVTAKGFERRKAPATRRLAAAPVDFDLRLGTMTQEVDVVDATPFCKPKPSTLSNLRTEKAIRDLPLNGRNFAQFCSSRQE